MFSKIKIALGIAVTAVIAFLSVMLNVRTNQRDKAVVERETVETHLDKAVEANESHKKLNEVNDAIEKASDSIRNTPVNDRRARLLKQSENYHGRKDSN